MTLAIPARAFTRGDGWPCHGAALAATAAVLLLAFRSDVADLSGLWWTSTTFGHCLFVGPVLAWLVWQRRRELARVEPVAWWPGLLVVAAGGFGWLLGDAGGVALARQLGLLLMLEGAVVTLLGPRVARALAFPLGYAVFLVPFGEGLEPPLQDATVALVMPMLRLAGVPAAVDGVVIHAGPYWFEVAEACSGAKFVIAMAAFGVLVANQCFRSWGRRAAFLLACLVVPVLANGLRAFGTIYAAQVAGVAAATGFDHVVYGWVFFALVMAAVLGLGWRWFDRAPDDPAFDPERLGPAPRARADLLAAALAAPAVAGLFPTWSGAVAGRAAALPARIELPDPPGWRRAGADAAWRPSHPGADLQAFGRYLDDRGDEVDLALAVYRDQREGRELVSYGTGVVPEGSAWRRVADLAPLGGGSVVRIRAPGSVERVVATWYRVGDAVTSDEPRVKWETARARLAGGPQRAAALHLAVPVRPGRDPRAALSRFLAALGPVDRAVDRAAGVR